MYCVGLSSVFSQVTINNNQALSNPLIEAVKSGTIDEVKKIIASDSQSLKSVDERQMTPLHYAAEKGYADIADYLIEKGADMNAKNARGSKPIHIASSTGQLDVVKILVKRGADIQEPNNLGRGV